MPLNSESLFQVGIKDKHDAVPTGAFISRGKFVNYKYAKDRPAEDIIRH